jgi:hypothetical protein
VFVIWNCPILTSSYCPVYLFRYRECPELPKPHLESQICESCNLFSKLCNIFTPELNDLCIKIDDMKKLRTIATIMFLSLILCGMTSCEVGRHTDNGRHRGWFHKHEDNRPRRDAVIIFDQDHRDDLDRR